MFYNACLMGEPQPLLFAVRRAEGWQRPVRRRDVHVCFDDGIPPRSLHGCMTLSEGGSCSSAGATAAKSGGCMTGATFTRYELWRVRHYEAL